MLWRTSNSIRMLPSVFFQAPGHSCFLWREVLECYCYWGYNVRIAVHTSGVLRNWTHSLLSFLKYLRSTKLDSTSVLTKMQIPCLQPHVLNRNLQRVGSSNLYFQKHLMGFRYTSEFGERWVCQHPFPLWDILSFLQHQREIQRILTLLVEGSSHFEGACL